MQSSELAGSIKAVGSLKLTLSFGAIQLFEAVGSLDLISLFRAVGLLN